MRSVAFIDIEKAYDSVDHELLWIKLQKIGIPPRFINMIKIVYQKMEVVRIGQHVMEEPIRITRGVMQGDPMSAILFNLFLSDFDEEMKGEEIPKINFFHTKAEIAYLQFADDVALFAENALYLQKLLNITQKYFIQNKLKVNEKKSKIMIFKKGGRGKKQERFYLNEQKLEIVQSYKYLGVKFQHTGKFHLTAKEMVGRAKQRIDALWPWLTRVGFPKFFNYLYYCDTVILSAVLFSSQIWALDQYDILERVQTYFLRKLLLVFPPRAANFFLRLELGRKHVKLQIMTMAIKFHYKVHNLQEQRLPQILLRELNYHQKQKVITNKSKAKSWLSNYTNLLNQYGASVEAIQQMFEVGKRGALNNFLERVMTSLTNEDLIRAQSSNSYNYYREPFISHIPPRYTVTAWPLYLRRLNAAVRNKSTWIALSNKISLRLYQHETCPLCSSKEMFDLFHILTQCEIIHPYRQHIKCQFVSYPQDLFERTFTDLSLIQLKTIHNQLSVFVKLLNLTM